MADDTGDGFPFDEKWAVLDANFRECFCTASCAEEYLHIKKGDLSEFFSVAPETQAKCEKCECTMEHANCAEGWGADLAKDYQQALEKRTKMAKGELPYDGQSLELWTDYPARADHQRLKAKNKGATKTMGEPTKDDKKDKGEGGGFFEELAAEFGEDAAEHKRRLFAKGLVRMAADGTAAALSNGDTQVNAQLTAFFQTPAGQAAVALFIATATKALPESIKTDEFKRLIREVRIGPANDAIDGLVEKVMKPMRHAVMGYLGNPEAFQLDSGLTGGDPSKSLESGAKAPETPKADAKDEVVTPTRVRKPRAKKVQATVTSSTANPPPSGAPAGSGFEVKTVNGVAPAPSAPLD